ncbi:MAG: hypothetical protein JKY93_04220 [Gammaproteobacteria bacterium]|nr:hypothetical protein [Gammaproteobacteria bacterium]
MRQSHQNKGFSAVSLDLLVQKKRLEKQQHLKNDRHQLALEIAELAHNMDEYQANVDPDYNSEITFNSFEK